MPSFPVLPRLARTRNDKLKPLVTAAFTLQIPTLADRVRHGIGSHWVWRRSVRDCKGANLAGPNPKRGVALYMPPAVANLHASAE